MSHEQDKLVCWGLNCLGVKAETKPRDGFGVNQIWRFPNFPGIREVKLVEVLGMPMTGKTTSICKWADGINSQEGEGTVVVVPEAAGLMKAEMGDLRITDPVFYTFLTGVKNWDSRKRMPFRSNTRMVIFDRWILDQQVFRRWRTSQGLVGPQFLSNRGSLMAYSGFGSGDLTASIMFLARPEFLLSRGVGTGPVHNLSALRSLCEQYWLLHGSIVCYRNPGQWYECLDAEEDKDLVERQFFEFMNQVLV